MNKPIIAAKKPVSANLQKGKAYYWCRCGRSNRQPFCDGSHAGTPFRSMAFTIDSDQEAWLCQCKQTKNPPFCDGTHASLKDDDVGKEASEDNETSVSSYSIEDNSINAAPIMAKSTPEEPNIELIHELAENGLKNLGHHGEMGAMGVPRNKLPSWDDVQVLCAQLAQKPLQEDVEVGTELVIGKKAKRPLQLDIPIFVSDMSFGALSFEAKVAMSKGAEMAGTGICSGEGGALPEEYQENTRYFYELASAMFGFSEAVIKRSQAFHFKCGQAAKTGTGGHLPANKVTEKIASVRGIEVGEAAVSPPTFTELVTIADFADFANEVRAITGGIPIGFKLSANHIEADIDFAMQAGADYIILDGRGGGTGAAPLLFRDNISVPTIPALARARKFLDNNNCQNISLIVTGGLRTPADFIKALCLGADGIAIANSAMQAIGCIGARMCNTNLCPAGIATQDEELRKKVNIDNAASRLNNFLRATVELMQVMARACGHDHLSKFSLADITTFNLDLAELSGISYAGVPYDS